MMRQCGIGDAELSLDIADDEAIGVGREKELRDAQAGLCARGCEHVGVLGDLLGGLLLGSGGGHISTIEEI
jgi:hypothetical protein